MDAPNDYDPLDILEYCNGGTDVYDGKHQPAIGRQSFHGLPFQVGAEVGKHCFVVLGPEAPGVVTVPVGRAAYHVLFELDSRLHEGDPVGRVVAAAAGRR